MITSDHITAKKHKVGASLRVRVFKGKGFKGEDISGSGCFRVRVV